MTNAYAVGRHLIDLPADFKLANGASATFVPIFDRKPGSEIDIMVVEADVPHGRFLSSVADRHKELARRGGGGEDVLEAVIRQSENTVLFRVVEVEDAYMSETDVFIGGTYLRMVGHSYHGKFAAVESSMARFVERIGLASAENDAEAFHVGVLSKSGQNAVERADLLFRSDRRPDLLLNVTIDTYARDEAKTLLHRTQGGDSLLSIFDLRYRVLRKRELVVAGMRAQEWLGVAHLEGEDTYGFAFETMRPDPGPATPTLHIELDSGQYDVNQKKRPNSLTDKTAVRLWDSMIESIRSAAP